jgi:tetratricopeptide (TPR) repeat protein
MLNDTSEQSNTDLRTLILLACLAACIAGSFSRNFIWRDSLASWLDAQAKAPGKARTNYELGLAYSKVSDFANAYTYLARAKELDAKFFSRAAAPSEVVNAANPAEAAAEYRRRMLEEPSRASLHNNLGTAYYDMGQMNEAQGEFREAIRLDPSLAAAHSNLGYVYYTLGYLDGAVSEYRIAIKLAPDDPEPHVKLGIAMERMQLPVEALAEMQTADSLKPGNANIRNALNRLANAAEKYRPRAPEHPRP